MVLIYGGSYNGKTDFAIKKYNLKNEDIFYCNSLELKFSYKSIVGLHIFIKHCVLNNISALDVIKNNLDYIKDKVIICDEIGSGIVPLKSEDRLWREECGRVLQFLSKNSNKVYRIFFGIEEVLKNE